MVFTRRRHPRSIGLLIDRQKLQLLQLGLTGSRLAVLAAAQSPVKAGGDFPNLLEQVQVLRELRASAPFYGNRVHAAVPSWTAHVRTIRLAHGQSGQLEAEARREAAALFPFDLREAIVRLFHAGLVYEQSQQFREVIVAAVRNEDFNQLQQLLAHAQMTLASLQLQHIAIHRAASRVSGCPAPYAIVEVAWDRTTVLLGTGDRVCFIKAIGVGGAAIEAAISDRLQLEVDEVRQLRCRLSGSSMARPARRDAVGGAIFDATRQIYEDLSLQIRQCLRYSSISFRGPQPKYIHLLGSESGDAHLRAAFASSLPVPIAPLDLMESIDLDAIPFADRSKCGEWYMPLGLALTEMPGLSAHSQNALAA